MKILRSRIVNNNNGVIKVQISLKISNENCLESFCIVNVANKCYYRDYVGLSKTIVLINVVIDWNTLRLCRGVENVHTKIYVLGKTSKYA